MGKLGKLFVIIFLVSIFVLFQNFKLPYQDSNLSLDTQGVSKIVYPEGFGTGFSSSTYNNKLEELESHMFFHDDGGSIQYFACDPQDKKVFYIDLNKIINLEDPFLKIQVSSRLSTLLEESFNLDSALLSAGPCLDVNDNLVGLGVLKVCLPEASESFYFKIDIGSERQRELIFSGIETVDLKCEKDRFIFPLKLDFFNQDLNLDSNLNDWNK